MPQVNMKKLEITLQKPVTLLTRKDLEDDNGRRLVEASKNGNVVILVPGDPMVATTHVSLRLILARKKIQTRIVHGQSIISAIVGATGLQNYKFGKSITMPSEQQQPVPQSLLDTLNDNLSRGLHTLIFLDPATETHTLTISEAIRRLVKSQRGLTDQIAVGAARIGSYDQYVKAGKMRDLINQDFGALPHVLVVPGKLHFIEIEALETFCGASKIDLENATC
jgi:diphthine synthase